MALQPPEQVRQSPTNNLSQKKIFEKKKREGNRENKNKNKNKEKEEEEEEEEEEELRRKIISWKLDRPEENCH